MSSGVSSQGNAGQHRGRGRRAAAEGVKRSAPLPHPKKNWLTADSPAVESFERTPTYVIVGGLVLSLPRVSGVRVWRCGVAWGTDARGDAGVDDAGGRDARSDATGIFQPGTQPGELTAPMRNASVCADCHGFYGEYDADSTWKGTMMANAARDPLFHAALTVARQDEPSSGDLCIRCHAPRAWLFGRSEPALISNLEKDDFESVQCDFCHRLNTGPSGTPYIGNGQYFVANDFTRRGPIRDAIAPHDFEYSAYHEESRLCGLCHDVSNPLRNGFAIERTYTEWLTSAFAAEGQSCQSCHMPERRGFACGAPGMPERNVHAHEFAGGNYWMPRVLAKEHPELKQGDAYEKTALSAEGQLKGASEITLQVPPRATAGEKVSFRVRVENKTGHKLPTGYPEGRRMWLEVEVTDELGASLLHSGAYDRATAERATDPQLRTYEVRMAANGVEGFHFILQDEVLQDNRIPPRGFVPRPDTKPVGREYPTVSSGDSGEAGKLAHWDDAPYELADAKRRLRNGCGARDTLVSDNLARICRILEECQWHR